MKRPAPMPGGDLEYAALLELWRSGAATAREVHQQIGAPDGLAYTTTAKVLDRLHAKGLVSRELVGKAFVYRPAVAREAVEGARARTWLHKLLGQEPQPAIAALVHAVEETDPRLLDELARQVSARRKARRGS